jgi:hypothetical protein
MYKWAGKLARTHATCTQEWQHWQIRNNMEYHKIWPLFKVLSIWSRKCWSAFFGNSFFSFFFILNKDNMAMRIWNSSRIFPHRFQSRQTIRLLSYSLRFRMKYFIFLLKSLANFSVCPKCSFFIIYSNQSKKINLHIICEFFHLFVREIFEIVKWYAFFQRSTVAYIPTFWPINFFFQFNNQVSTNWKLKLLNSVLAFYGKCTTKFNIL